MRHYEIVLLIHPGQSEQVPTMLERYQDMVTAGAEAKDAGGGEKGLVHRVEDWGRRRLAYMIQDVHKAHYVMLNIECGLETLRELEKNFKFNDAILRSLVIRRDQAVTEQSVLGKAKVEEDRLEAERMVADAAADAAAKAKSAAEVEAVESAESNSDSTLEVAAETVADSAEELDDAPDQPLDEPPAVPSTEQSSDSSTEQPGDLATEQPSDLPTEQPGDLATDPSTEQPEKA